MAKNAIKVFARIKPEANKEQMVKHQIHKRPREHLDEDYLTLSSQKFINEYIDNRPESWNFSFYKVFEDTTQQEDIFNDVARPVVRSLFDGYNGTIFAYGQTGSGKTYTITGEPRDSRESGILPRTLRYVFETIEKHPNNVYKVELSYIEIYNESGYDLLPQSERDSLSRLDDLPRVEIQEDEMGVMHLKNVEYHTVECEEEAMDLLYTGDKNRATSETPMNPRSSRSHCIFTIVLLSKKIGSNHCTRAKIHLVDLAGSERVYKCAITGTILTEAKYINLSLHYLEQVIVCLGQESSSHVPYRNSLLTGILRDSLGGNCITIMLATLSVSRCNLEVIKLIKHTVNTETVSTCRFAQRVALITNYDKLISEGNVQTETELLRIENKRLKEEIDKLKEQQTAAVSKDIEYYKSLVQQRDNKICILIRNVVLLIAALNKEKSRKTKQTVEKIVETDKPQLSIVPNKSVDITPSVSKEKTPPRKVADFSRNKVTDTNGDKLIDKVTPAECSKTETESNRLSEVTVSDINTNGHQVLRQNPTTAENNQGQLLIPEREIKLNTTGDAQRLHVINSQHKTAIEFIQGFQNSTDESLDVKSYGENSVVEETTFSGNTVKFGKEGNQNVNGVFEDYQKIVKKNERYDDDDFVKVLPLTGDREIDEEIIAFYRAKRFGSYY